MTSLKSRLTEKILLFGLLAAVFLTLAQFGQPASPSAPYEMREVSSGWYYLEDGVPVSLTLPCTVQLEDGRDLVLYYDDLTAAEGSRTLATRGGVYRLQIQLNGSTLYTYDDGAFFRNRQMRSKLTCLAILPENPDGMQLTLTYENQGDGTFDLQPIFLGFSSAVFRHLCAEDSFTLVVVFFMLIISMFSLALAWYLRKVHMPDPRFFHVASLLILCSGWCLLDSALFQHLSGQSPIVFCLSFYSLMTLAIPMTHFVRCTGSLHKSRSLEIYLALFYCNVIIQSLLHVFAGVAFADMLFVTHLLLAGGMGLASLLLFLEYRRVRSRELLTTLAAFLILSASGLLAIFLYWSASILYYNVIFECGLLLFIVFLLASITASMTANLRFRTEAQVYRRLSREDRLSGLENRWAYDELMSQLEAEPEKHRDVALLFLDLNYLKQTNDHFGHSAGDELIISAAKSIRSAFGAQGNCFRIGGDEFAVVIPDPVDTPEQWQARLDMFLQIYNQMSNHPVSIAWGYSFLRDEQGKVKRFSDWKAEADRAMYRNKHQSKEGEGRAT